jgi:hypothetical protein
VLRSAALSLGCAAIAPAGVAGVASAAPGIPPNLDMQAPYDIQKTTDGVGHSFVAFGVSITNRGPGVLKVVGKRPPHSAQMDATQVLLTTDSVRTGVAAQTVPNVGKLQFSPSPSHFHWHFVHVEDYQLLSVPDLDFVAPTRKTGFCLSGLNKRSYCGGGLPALHTIGGPAADTSPTTPNPRTWAMGMIVRDGPDARLPNRSASDDYGPTIEGQDIEITGVPAARYCLSFVVNPDEKLVETSTTDNGSSAFVDIGGAPGSDRTVSLPPDTDAVPTVFADSATCGLAKPRTRAAPLTRRSTAKLTTTALRKALAAPKGITGACRVKSADWAWCRVVFEQAGARYNGMVKITQRAASGQSRWFYKVDVKRSRTGSCAAVDQCPARIRTATLLGGLRGVNRAAARAALRIPSGRRAPSKPGAAWKGSYLCKLNTPTAR